MKSFVHILIISLLTVVTQIGGLLWILNFGYYKIKKSSWSRWKKIFSFSILYIISTFLIVPNIAKLNGRIPLPITKSSNLMPHNYITPLLNRNYVKPKLKNQLTRIANDIHKENKKLKLSYLDANFPFIDGFPLLPHLSHNDGRKVDLSFYYTKDKTEGNLKPSKTGYGKFVNPIKNEFNQTRECKSKGYWHYDYTKFLTMGSRDDLEFDQANTKMLVNLIIDDKLTQKILIESHLKKRMNLSNRKVRFQGCHAVRHDDHIHHQIVK